MPHYLIGVDVGATKIAAGLVVDGRVSHVVRVASPKTSRQDFIAAITKIIGVFHHPKIAGVGVGIPGAVDAARGLVYSSPNLPRDFKNVALRRVLARRVALPVTIENDAKCFTFAEAKLGAGKGKATVVGFTLGSGIGGGVVINGQILHGHRGLAGELGHTIVVEHGLDCSCGQTGHLESYASGGGMSRFYRQLTGETIDLFELERRAKAGDTAARRALANGSEVLAVGLANAITTFNPDLVVLGGGLTRVPSYWRPAVRRVPQLVPYREYLPTPIVKAKLDANAGIIGAALISATTMQNAKIKVQN